jgi:hypothetical protein
LRDRSNLALALRQSALDCVAAFLEQLSFFNYALSLTFDVIYEPGE